ncbi:MAG: P1 family peptidase [Candidatus Promineifilaceae bacterium]
MIRARELGITISGEPGPLNAITDVDGTLVGHSTIISGSGPMITGQGPVRTGVTAILPRGRDIDPVFAGWYALNGNGEMTGTTWIEESGFMRGPVMITNTNSVGLVRDAVIDYGINHFSVSQDLTNHWFLPVVAETFDGFLNDVNGFHVKREHVFMALDKAASGIPAEGNVGGGTGMICHDFKGGIGTSSRIVRLEGEAITVGALVQANYGARKHLTIDGVPVGLEISDLLPVSEGHAEGMAGGSIIVVIATDGPLLPHQLKRLARRVPMGIARVGGFGADNSGDIFVAYSTANPGTAGGKVGYSVETLPNEQLTPFFEATALAVEEAIVNALIAAETMVGRDNNKVFALPHGRLIDAMKKYNRLPT